MSGEARSMGFWGVYCLAQGAYLRVFQEDPLYCGIAWICISLLLLALFVWELIDPEEERFRRLVDRMSDRFWREYDEGKHPKIAAKIARQRLGWLALKERIKGVNCHLSWDEHVALMGKKMGYATPVIDPRRGARDGSDDPGVGAAPDEGGVS